jgi:hypothetical protein
MSSEAVRLSFLGLWTLTDAGTAIDRGDSLMASREALLASVVADLKTYHDARMGLPDDEMQKLTSSVTDSIPERAVLPPPSPLLPTACRLQPCRVSSKTEKPRAGLGSASSCQERLGDRASLFAGGREKVRLSFLMHSFLNDRL